MGDGNGARGVCRRATAPKNVMSRTWYFARTLAVAIIVAALPSVARSQAASPGPAQPAPSSAAQAAAPARPAQATPARPAPRPQPKEGEVQSDPIKCWWKADRTAVRVGERFGLV